MLFQKVINASVRCFFVCVYSSSAYFLVVKWSISKKSIIFQGSREGSPNIFQGGGPIFTRLGVQLLVKLVIFQGGPDLLDPHLCKAWHRRGQV